MSGDPSKGVFADILRVSLLVVVFTAMALLLQRPGVRKLFFDMNTIRSELKGTGEVSGCVYSGLVFALAGGILNALGVPRLWVSAVGGIIYGAVMGSIFSMLASLLGASILYLAGKSILATVVERRLGDKVNLWKVRFQENAFWWVLYIILFPFSNSTVMGLVCGSCRVPYLPFISAALVGFIPLAVVFATYGSGGAKGNIWQIGVATLLLVCSITLRSFLKRWFPAAKGQGNASAGAEFDG
jgi:uncharacterized membrane protein YdjX (TVP38/TMEM64 family)